MAEKKIQKKNSLPGRVASMHGMFLKLGPKIGGPLVKLTALYCLYRVFSNGGIESLSFVCYEHMLREGVAEKENKKHGA